MHKFCACFAKGPNESLGNYKSIGMSNVVQNISKVSGKLQTKMMNGFVKMIQNWR
jgi:hypothetical protein